MLDDLRNSSAFIEEEPVTEQETAVRLRSYRRRKSTFLGMTAPQRFFLSLMLFFMVLLLGIVTLVATGSINIVF